MTRPWTDLEYSKTEVGAAGEILRRWYVVEGLVSETEVEHAQAVLTNWRAAHGFVRNTGAMGLRSRADRLGIDADVASRTKARSSIYAKLAERPDLKLNAMRDIAGARAVVPTLADQERLVNAYTEVEDSRVHDYRDGKDDGYRAVHIDLVLEDPHTREPARRRRKVELQIRTRAQHDWADFVESIGRRTGHRLKQGIGPQWLLERLAELSEAYADLDAARSRSGAMQEHLDRVARQRGAIERELGDEA